MKIARRTLSVRAWFLLPVLALLAACGGPWRDGYFKKGVDRLTEEEVYEKMGPLRYFVGVNLFLIMMMVPIKMYLRWAFNLKYILYLQEFSFNV